MILARLLYFLSHPSEYLGLWTLDLTAVTVILSVATLIVVLVQLRLMGRQTGLMTEQTTLMQHQDTLMQRQTDVLVRQDETNRQLLSRRAKLVMYTQPSPPAQVVVLCRNDGNKTAQNFYWHLAVPVSVRHVDVRDIPLNGGMLDFTGTEFLEGEHYRHYVGNPGQDERDSGMIPNGVPG